MNGFRPIPPSQRLVCVSCSGNYADIIQYRSQLIFQSYHTTIASMYYFLFQVNDPMTIASLSSGWTTTNKSAVNCEDAVRIGKEMQKDLDDESPVKSMKTSNKCKKSGCRSEGSKNRRQEGVHRKDPTV